MNKAIRFNGPMTEWLVFHKNGKVCNIAELELVVACHNISNGLAIMASQGIELSVIHDYVNSSLELIAMGMNQIDKTGTFNLADMLEKAGMRVDENGDKIEPKGKKD